MIWASKSESGKRNIETREAENVALAETGARHLNIRHLDLETWRREESSFGGAESEFLAGVRHEGRCININHGN